MRRVVHHLLFGIACLALLTWLYFQSIRIDVDRHIRTVHHFEQLRERDASLNQYVLQARSGLLRNYDPLVSTQVDVQSILARLEQDQPVSFGPGSMPSQQAFSAYKLALQKKSELIESFKSHNAVLGNSARYFPLAAKVEYARQAGHRPGEVLVHELLEGVLLLDQYANNKIELQVKDTVNRIVNSPLGQSDPMRSLLQHVRIILEHKTEVDQLVRDITQAQTALMAERAFAHYSEDFTQRDKQAQRFKLAMALLAAFLIAYVGWLLTHLERARRTLVDSLRELEFQKSALDKHSIVSITDRAGKILYTNDKFSEVSLYSREELLGQDHRLLNSGHHPSSFFKEMWATIARGQVWQAEVRNRRKDGSYYWVDSTIAPFLDVDGKPLRYVSIRTDITARKAYEATMLEARNEAEAARQAAETANRIKSDFLANMSHEIRTPMNGIMGMTNLALLTELTAEQHEYLALIKSSADSLLQVINDILDFSKIESGKLNIERIEFSLEGLLRDTTKTLAIRAHEKNIELLLNVAPNVPDRLLGDPGRLRQVLINLLGNAVKFTQSGEVELAVQRVHVPDKTGCHLRFSVRDTGIGIAPEKFQTIFESFSQADTSTTRNFGGTGLGLTISAQIVQLMGGRIELTSTVGEGSTFFFTVELPSTSDFSLAHYLQTGSVAGLRILIVDDNETHRNLLGEMLSNWKMLPTAVASGKDALRELQQAFIQGTPFALTLLEVGLPDVDACDLARRIRTHGSYATTTIMMLTTQDLAGATTGCHDLSETTTVMKPVTQSELLDAVISALGVPKPSAPEVPVTQNKQQDKVPLRLLLAEDNKVNQLLAIRLLELAGHSVKLAKNGREALEQWRAAEFDAILMDVDMPEMNGYEATRQIRLEESTTGNHIPIIAMTAHAMKGSREECLSHGMDGYVSKPIDANILWSELAHLGRQPATTAEGRSPSSGDDLCTVDFVKARQTMDNDPLLFEEIVRQYLLDAPVVIANLQSALSTGRVLDIKKFAHTVQGMVAVFSSQRCIQLARDVEATADQEVCASYVASLARAMQDLDEALRNFRW